MLIDYAHTPDALERALGALRPLVAREAWWSCSARAATATPGSGRRWDASAAGGADLTIVTSDNPRHEDPDADRGAVESGMGDAPRRRIIDRREAIRTALQEAGPDDLVLLAGKGHETYQIWGDEQRPFDERVVVREIFAGEGATL